MHHFLLTNPYVLQMIVLVIFILDIVVLSIYYLPHATKLQLWLYLTQLTLYNADSIALSLFTTCYEITDVIVFSLFSGIFVNKLCCY